MLKVSALAGGAGASERWFLCRSCKKVYASKELKNDREIVIAAVANNGKSLEYASNALQKDPEVIQNAIRGGRLDLATYEQKANLAVVKSAVSKDGCALKHASIDLQNERQQRRLQSYFSSTQKH